MKVEWPIFVVSLANSTDRRLAINQQFERAGLNFQFFDAVDGRKGLSSDLESKIDRPGTVAHSGTPMSDTEYACALSHMTVYEHILKAGLQGAIILEDDAILTSNFVRFVNDRVYESGSLVQLFHFNGQEWRFLTKKRSGLRFKRLSANAFGTVGYSISAKAAAILLHESLPLRARADWPCETFRLFDHYVVSPRPILHPLDAEGQSLIETQDPPTDIDYSAGYAKGLHRLVSLASWKRFLTRPFKLKKEIDQTLAPSSEEAATILVPVSVSNS